MSAWWLQFNCKTRQRSMFLFFVVNPCCITCAGSATMWSDHVTTCFYQYECQLLAQTHVCGLAAFIH